MSLSRTLVVLFVAVIIPQAVAQSVHSTTEQTVNWFATVESDDGYLNMRSTPTSRENNVRARVPSGERVLVVSCQDREQGKRWCSIGRSAFASENRGGAVINSGVVYDAELVYDRPIPARGHTVAGSSVAPYLVSDLAHVYVNSEDGYMNLRSEPTSQRDNVLTRLPNPTDVTILACQRGRSIGSRWCLVEVPYPRDPEGFPVLGYLYDAEIEYDGN